MDLNWSTGRNSGTVVASVKGGEERRGGGEGCESPIMNDTMPASAKGLRTGTASREPYQQSHVPVLRVGAGAADAASAEGPPRESNEATHSTRRTYRCKPTCKNPGSVGSLVLSVMGYRSVRFGSVLFGSVRFCLYTSIVVL